MTVRFGRVANRFVLRMASATGQPRLLIRPSPRRAPASWLTARVWCSRPAFVGMIAPERQLDRPRTACVQLAAPVARSNERHGRHHRCDDRAARSLAAGAGPWNDLTRDVRPIERLVSCVVARRQPHFLWVGADGLDDDFSEGWCRTRRSVRGQCPGGECRHVPQLTSHRTDDSCCISSPPVVATISA